METQVLSTEQMRELINMGVDISKASCTWCKVRAITPDRKGYSWMILPETLNKLDKDHVPTFTLQDMLEMLPVEIDGLLWRLGHGCIYYQDIHTGYINENLVAYGKTINEAVFNMLKLCKQNNYI